MQTGVVQFFIPSKGYGFIRVVATKEEFYFKQKPIQDGPVLQKGDEVRFELTEDRHGLQAIKVVKISQNK